MSSKRIASSAVNWAALAERVPENQRIFFNALKGRSDGYLRRVLSNPETAPKIDWSVYKSKVALPGLVDSFQKQYEAFKVPYPQDKVTPEVDAQQKQAEAEIKSFVEASNRRIATYQAAISKWDDVLPFEEMTLEEYKDAFPEDSLDPINNPTFWPHNPEEQLDYKAPDAAAALEHK